MDMKKRIAGIACAAMLASAVAVPAAYAAGGAGQGFIDSNGDGICDYRGTSSATGYCGGRFQHLFGNGAGQGVNQGAGQGMGQGAGQGAGGGNFVDSNGDGVCDNVGTGQGAGGGNYVDSNGDGVCDNAGTGCGAGQGAGSGCGYRGGR